MPRLTRDTKTRYTQNAVSLSTAKPEVRAYTDLSCSPQPRVHALGTDACVHAKVESFQTTPTAFRAGAREDKQPQKHAHPQRSPPGTPAYLPEVVETKGGAWRRDHRRFSCQPLPSTGRCRRRTMLPPTAIAPAVAGNIRHRPFASIYTP